MTTTETAEARALLPCPLCGTSHLRMVQVFRPASEGDFQWRVGHDPDKAGFSCFTSGPVRDTKEEAATVWNTRPSLTPPAQGGEWNAAVEAAAQKVANSVVDGPAAVRGWFAARIRELAIPYASPGSEDEIDPVATEAHSRGMDEGATFVLESLARQLGVTDYQQADGSEEWEGDVSGTVHNILIAASVVDDYTGRIAHLGDATPSAPTAERLRSAAEAIVAAQTMRDGFYIGWNITALNKAVEQLRSALGMEPTLLSPETLRMMEHASKNRDAIRAARDQPQSGEGGE